MTLSASAKRELTKLIDEHVKDAKARVMQNRDNGTDWQKGYRSGQLAGTDELGTKLKLKLTMLRDDTIEAKRDEFREGDD